MLTICDIERDNKDKTMEEYSNSIDIFSRTLPIITKIVDLIDSEILLRTFKNVKLYYAINGNSTYLETRTTLEENIRNKHKKRYIFSDLLKDNISHICSSLIKLPSIEGKFIKNRLYCGSRGTGSHFHFHPPAVNYLVSGMKLWIMMPFSKRNIYLYQKYFEYGTITEDITLWLNKKYKLILSHCENCIVFIQNSGTSVFVPDSYFHFVLNLSDVIGITYSWENNKS